MGKVRRFKRTDRPSKPWYVEWRDENGKRTRKSFVSKDKRDGYASKLEKRIDKSGVGIMGLSPEECQQVIFLKDKYKIESIADIEKFLNPEKVASYNPQKLDFVIGEFLRARKLMGVTEAYLGHAKGALRKFCDYFDNVYISDLTAP